MQIYYSFTNNVLKSFFFLVLAHRTSQFTKDQTCGDLVRQREIELAKIANAVI